MKTRCKVCNNIQIKPDGEVVNNTHDKVKEEYKGVYMDAEEYHIHYKCNTCKGIVVYHKFVDIHWWDIEGFIEYK